MNGYAAQCLMCRFARIVRRAPRACERFPDPDDTQELLNKILWRDAGTQSCVALEKHVAGPDAYLAHDEPGMTVGEAITEAAKSEHPELHPVWLLK